MKYEKYVSLIKRLEDFAARRPQAYRWRVVALAILGYAYFLLMAGATAAIPLGLAGLIIFYPKILIFLFKGFLLKIVWLIVIFGAGLASFFWSAIRSLFVQLPAPEGYELKKEEAPKLFEFIERASEKLKTPLPTHIVLNDDFNASVINLTKFGFFGCKTYLNVGLPLMQALSPAQFEAVVAHEMGHLSENHGKYSAWIYRLHETWSRFLAIQESSEQKISFLYNRFLNWYFPYFSAYAFVLMREQEREADRCSVRLVGAKAAGEALINAELKASHLKNGFWREVLEEAATNPKPPQAVFSRMAVAFRQPSDSAKDILTLTKALAIHTDYDNPHPCLSDRLHQIGYWQNGKNAVNKLEREFDLPALPQPSNENAADYFFGKNVESFAKQFDREWQTRVAQEWKAQHEFLAQAGKRLSELEAKVGAGETLTADELYERANLISLKDGDRAALPILQEIIAAHPENAAATYTLGSILLEDGDESGIEYLKKAMLSAPDAELSACELIFRFLQSHGREEEAKVYLDRAERLYEVYSAAQKERETITDKDCFEMHELPPETVERAREIVSWHEEIKFAYLVKKRVEHLPEQPFHVLCLQIKMKWNPFGSGVSEQDVLEAVVKQVGEIGIHYVLILNRKFAATKSQVEKLTEAKIY